MKAKYFLVTFCIGAIVTLSNWWVSQSLMAQGGSTAVFINEIHYDNVSTDADEAIEIAGPAGTDLAGWSLVLYNGSGGAVYNTNALSGVIPDQQGGYGTLNFSYPSNGIQNGAPDGIALVDPANAVVQFLSYEGTFAAVGGPADGLSSTDIGVSEPGSDALGNSLQLGGAGVVYEDFSWNGPAPSTPGLINNGQTFGDGGPMTPNVVINELDSDTAGADLLEFVELYDGGAGNTDLSGLVVVFYNGSVDTSYAAYDLDGFTTDANGYFVLGNSGVTPTPGIVFASNNLQNGADAVALYAADSAAFPNGAALTTENLLDAVVYDTADADDPELLALLNAGEPQVNEDANANKDFESIGRCPNGEGGARNTGGFATRAPTPGAANDCDNGGGGGEIGLCGEPATLISAIQGSGNASPIPGATAIVEAVVVGDYQGSNKLSGYFLQEEDANADGDAATSEALFVFEVATPLVDVNVGDLVRVGGVVDENFGVTSLETLADVVVCSSGNGLPTPAQLQLPIPNFTATDPASAQVQINAYFEPAEGMLATFSQSLSAAEYFELSRFGQIVLASERLRQFTDVSAPSVAGNNQHLADVASKSIILDDDNNIQNAALVDNNTAEDESVFYPEPGGFSVSNFFRGGDTIAGLTGVLDFAFSEWRIRPVQEQYDYTFASANARTAAPNSVGGSFKVASFNVLNYFNGDGQGGGFPTSRGANSPAEFERQRAKIISAFVGLDADVVGLIEIENDPTPNSAVEDLVAGINNVLGAGAYAYIDTGVVGTDEIRQAFIYRTATAAPVGPHAVLDSSVDPTFIDTRNRPALAQTFEQIATGEQLTVVVNHLKSKGSACDDIGDPDLGDGQANCSVTRTTAATALVNWLANDPTGTGDPDYLIIGDLNSYRNEDPIVALENGGFVDLLDQLNGATAYSYLFDGQLGYLDFALANGALAAQVTGVTAWHINADEVNLLDYNDMVLDAGEQSFDEKPGPNPLYEANAYRSSDHDPVIVGLALASGPVTTSITIQKDTQPESSRNFRFDGDLGRFRLDDITPQDNDQFGSSVTFNVAAGTYVVEEELPNNWYLGQIACDAGGVVDLTQNQVSITVAEGDNVTCTFVNQRSADIRVIKYNDTNQNGTRDKKEKGLKDWTITLYNANGVVATTTTNGSGKASFINVKPDDYTLCETQQAGWSNSQPGVIDPTYGEPCYSFTLAPAEIATVEFGNFESANRSDIIGASEVSGVTIVIEEDIFSDDDAGYDEEFVDPFLSVPLFTEEYFMPIIKR